MSVFFFFLKKKYVKLVGGRVLITFSRPPRSFFVPKSLGIIVCFFLRPNLCVLVCFWSQ